MARVVNNILQLEGQLGEMTFYTRNGKTFVRPKHIHQPRRLSYKQLVQREQLAHNNALWRMLKRAGDPRFEGGTGSYYRFMSVNNQSPTVFLTKQQLFTGFTLLLPEMMLSSGPLPPISYQLGEVDGRPALLTDLLATELRTDTLRLYTLEQDVLTYQCEEHDIPQLWIKKKEIAPNGEDVATVNGCVALTGDHFANPMTGFGVVRIADGHVSSQRVVTRCTYYERFTTEEAMQAAAKSYGGFTR